MARWHLIGLALVGVAGCFPAQPGSGSRIRGAGSVVTYETLGGGPGGGATAQRAPDRDLLLARIGARELVSPVVFALDAATLSGRRIGEFGQAESGPALVDLARARRRYRERAAVGELARGDILVFDGALDLAKASLLGVVVGEERPGTWSFVYVADGIVRRGLLTPSRPDHKRDRSGAALNTHLRHRETRRPPGTRFLAGQLFAGVIAAAP